MGISESADTDFDYLWAKREVYLDGIECDQCGTPIRRGSTVYVKKYKRTNKTVTYLCDQCGEEVV